MLCICFHLKQQNYAVDTGYIERVLPRMPVEPLDGAPPWLCGVFDWQGHAIPLVDFCMLCKGHASRALFSTRVMLLHCRDHLGQEQQLGLLTEGVTGTIRYRLESVHRLDLHLVKAPYLAEIITDSKGMVQLLDIDQLYNQELADLLRKKEQIIADS
ncbi:MAG: chemotaxis protein CheW [Mariprofundaceae bacterium]|nr:chemotaxis protein CheW [Mariprofundaceae bacterium]